MALINGYIFITKGNIISGIDFIRRNTSKTKGLKDDLEPPVFALTTPLVTTSTGEKFGKSAGNAIWLDKNLVSVYEFYQFFIKTPDSLIEKYLKYFTFLSIEEITDIIQKSITESGYAQKQLAFHVTELVHGYAAAQSAAIKSGILFNESNYNATDIINSLSTDSDFIRLDKSLVINSSLINIAVLSGSCPSKSAARKILNSGGVYIRGERVTDVSHVITKSDLLDDSLLVLRIGKQEFKIIQVV